MEKQEYPCPCGGKVDWKKDKVIVEGVECGILDVEYCAFCGEEYFPEETMEIVEKKLKAKGLWGVQPRKVNLWQSGKSVVLRIPKDMADELDLKPNEEVTIYVEGKKKIVVNL